MASPILPGAPVPPMSVAGGSHPATDGAAARRAAAGALEASFLTVMLGAAGLGAARQSFGGGAGEEQFTSFLVEAQAEAMVRKGGIGLAESLLRAMEGRSRGME
jgi:peptidoglycan hydrolase FlgJ